VDDESVDARKEEILAAAAILPNLVFESLPLHETFSLMRLPIFVSEQGCWLSAPYGSGKTTALRYCVNCIRAMWPDQAVFCVSEQVLPGNELRSFFVRALEESGHPIAALSASDKLRNRLAIHWAALARSSPLKRVVLFLDEGQSIREADEKLLKDLGNRVTEHGGAIQTITLGESPTLDLLVRNRVAKKDGAVDRLFGGHRLQLFQYKNEKDWKSLFEQMFAARFVELNNKTVYEAFFGHQDLSTFVAESDAHEFWMARNRLSHRSISINLRRTFVGIRHALLTSALHSLDGTAGKFTGINREKWFESLRYGAVLDEAGTGPKA
jgi:hypothetical protein